MGNSWAKDYQVAENIINQPTGKTTRPFPGGQKVGNLNVPNAPFSAQTLARSVTIAAYANPVNPVSKVQVLEISTPSRRLACGVQCYFEFDAPLTGLPLPGATPLALSLIELGVNPQNGQSTAMRVVGTLNGPGSFDVEPIYRDVRLVAEIDSNNLDWAAMGLNAARLIVVANWEPNTPMAPDELARLYSLCSLSVPQPAQV